jgi:DNA-binding NarL/FixJ family response regulator
VARHEAVGGPPGPAAVEHAAGRIAALLGRPEEAVERLGAARRATDTAGTHAVRALVDFDLAVLRGDAHRVADAGETFHRLGMRGWAVRARAWSPPALTGGRPSGLTTREVEVLRLLAAGRTSREIADALIVSLATVNRHIANVYVKIGARNRAEATAFAIGHGLTAA